VAHEVRRRRVCGLETVEEHVVASTVGLAVKRVVGEVVALRESPHFAGTQVVCAATAVQPPVSAQVVVVGRYVTSAAPLCA
jgi:hypothetical protein